MESYPRELSEGIQPLIFAIDGTDRGVDGTTVNSSSFDSLIQYMTLEQNYKNSKSSESKLVSESVGSSQSFFSRARVVTVSKTHTFPPSSDPVGNLNKTSKISSVLGLRAATQTSLSRGPPSPTKVQYSTATVSDNAIISYLRRNPIEGILSEGWIEKHAHALPSVVLVIVHVDVLTWNNKPTTAGFSSGKPSSINHVQPAYYHQAKVEKHLSDLCDHIRSSFAEKRACSIHLVCIIPTQSVGLKSGVSSTNSYTPSNSSFIQASTSTALATNVNEKIQNIRIVCKLPPGSVSILHYSTTDDKNTTNTLPFPMTELLKLEQVLQETSSSYYRHQMKRLKDKLIYLQLQTHPELLAAASRYCFKMAIFLEVEERTRESAGGRTSSINTLATTTTTTGSFMGFPKVVGRGKDLSPSMVGGESLKYWYDAYDFVATYYRYLMNGADEDESSTKYVPTDSTVDDKNGDLNVIDDDSNYIKGLPGLIAEENTIVVSQEVLDNGEMTAVLSSPLDPASEKDIEMGEPFIRTSTTTLTHIVTSTTQSIHAEDMHHQCRSFAHWVNYKILSKLFLLLSTLDTTLKKPLMDNPLTDAKSLNNRRKEILESLAKQVRRHCFIFLNINHLYVQNGLVQKTFDTVNDSIDPLWNRLLYAYQQRLALAQIIERYIQPLYVQLRQEKLATLVTVEVWDILNASSLYASVGDCVLRLDNAIRKELSLVKKSKMITHDDNRRKFVGSSSLFALKTRFQQERQRNYLVIAMDVMQRSVALREERNETTRKRKDALVAKYHFVIGLILMKERKYDEAIRVFQMSLKKCQEFRQIHLAIARTLMKCNQEASRVDQTEVPLSIILNPDTSCFVESSDLDKMIKEIFSLYPQGHYKAFNFVLQRERASPISYVITFPETVVVVHGDEVPLTIQLRSNLPFPLELKSIELSTNLGSVHSVELKGACRSTILSPKKIFCLQTSFKIQNVEHLISSSDDNRDIVKVSKLNTFGVSHIHSAGSVHGKLLKYLLTSGAISLRLSSISLTVSPSDFSGSSVILHLNSKESKSKVDKEMFITTSYSRPAVFPMKYGSSHLYITRPKARIEVSNTTAYFTKGKVLEGTVNRIIFELKPGPHEACRSMEISITCSSKIMSVIKDSLPALSSSLLDQEALLDSDDIDRSPVLVQQSNSTDATLPIGWTLYGENGRGIRDKWLPVTDYVHEGSSAHVVVDLFRLLPSHIDPEYPRSPCQTDITMLIRYSQINSDRHNRDEVWVTREFHDKVVWCSPISASFSIANHNIKSLPTGNYCNPSTQAITFLRAGDLVPIRCSAQAAEASDGLFVRLLDASFSSTFDEHEEPCSLDLIGNLSSDNLNAVIFKPKQNDVNSLLKSGTNINLLYVIRPTLKDSIFSKSPIFTRLGSIQFNWEPIPLRLSHDVNMNDAYKCFHGPLPLSTVSPIVYAGPKCYLEETPFFVKLKTMLDSPKVLMPFDVEYQVVNRMDFPQKIQLELDSTENETNRSFIVVGAGRCEIHMSPRETKSIFYTMLALRSGKGTIPKVKFSSELCESWVEHGGLDTIILP